VLCMDALCPKMAGAIATAMIRSVLRLRKNIMIPY
jgi:hypothetical protein